MLQGVSGEAISWDLPHMEWNTPWEHTKDLMDAEEHLVALAGAPEQVTAEQEDKLWARELDNFHVYAESLLADEDQFPDEEDVTVAGMVNGVSGLGVSTLSDEGMGIEYNKYCTDVEEVPITELEKHMARLSENSEWAPYPTKTVGIGVDKFIFTLHEVY